MWKFWLKSQVHEKSNNWPNYLLEKNVEKTLESSW